MDIPEFIVLPPDPQSRRQVLLLLILQATLPDEGEATLIPIVETGDGARPSPDLPPLRLRALRPLWTPLVNRSDSPRPGRDQQVLRLNTPSVWSGVAILPDEGATSRKQSRVLAEDWLSRLNPEGGTVAVVQTLKHMSASFNISKSTKTVPLTELRNDKFWARLFSEEAANQTIFVGLARPDARHAHAGVTIQASLRAFRGLLGASTLACALWLLEHEEVWRRLRRARGGGDGGFRALDRNCRASTSLDRPRRVDTRIRHLRGLRADRL